MMKAQIRSHGARWSKPMPAATPIAPRISNSHPMKETSGATKNGGGVMRRELYEPAEEHLADENHDQPGIQMSAE